MIKTATMEVDSLGEFWLPDNPEVRVSGRVVQIGESPVTLTLAGILPRKDSPEFSLSLGMNEDWRPTIHGELVSHPKGGRACFSMIGALETRRSYGSQFASTSYVGNRSYLGEFCVESDLERFDKSRVRYNNLSAWLNIHTTSVKNQSDHIEIKTNQSPALKLSFDGVEVEFVAETRVIRRGDETLLSDHASVQIAPTVPMTWGEYETQFVTSLARMVSLAMGEPESLSGLRYYRGEDHVDLLLESRPDATRSRAGHFHSLIPHPKQEVLKELFVRFLEFERLNPAFCNLFFALQKAPPTYIEIRLLAYIEALTLFVGEDADGYAWLSKSPEAATVVGEKNDPSEWTQSLESARSELWQSPDGLVSHANRLQWALHLGILSKLGFEPKTFGRHQRIHWLHSD